MKNNNKYVFPCGERFSAINTGYCQGVRIATKKNDNITYDSEKCAKCNLTRLREFHNEEGIDLVCLAHSEEYLENKDKQVVSYLSECPDGDYTIELIIQCEDFRAVRYVTGGTLGAGLLDLVDEDNLEDYFSDTFDENIGIYFIWMADSDGKLQLIEFESVDEIARSIISIRLIRLENNEDE